jgi:hypothetical protein
MPHPKEKDRGKIYKADADGDFEQVSKSPLAASCANTDNDLWICRTGFSSYR